MNLRDHDQPCEHGKSGPHCAKPSDPHSWCPGGREVTIDYEAAARILNLPNRNSDTAARIVAAVDAALGGSDE